MEMTQNELAKQKLSDEDTNFDDFDNGECLCFYSPLSDSIEDPRYILGSRGKYPLIAVGVNPSIATSQGLDKTVKKIKQVAEDNGFDSFVMFNISAERATNPKDMSAESCSILHESNKKEFEWLLEKYCTERLNLNEIKIWATWGGTINKKPYLKKYFLDLFEISKGYKNIKWMKYGELTKDGHPRHASRIKYSDPNNKLNTFDIEKYSEKIGKAVERSRKRANKSKIIILQ